MSKVAGTMYVSVGQAADREPICNHTERAGRVSWPAEMPKDGPGVSTYVCERTECIEDARRWVQTQTGHRGEFVALPADRVLRVTEAPRRTFGARTGNRFPGYGIERDLADAIYDELPGGCEACGPSEHGRRSDAESIADAVVELLRKRGIQL